MKLMKYKEKPACNPKQCLRNEYICYLLTCVKTTTLEPTALQLHQPL